MLLVIMPVIRLLLLAEKEVIDISYRDLVSDKQ